MSRRTTLIVLALLGLMVLVVTVTPQRTPPESGAERTRTPNAPTAILTDPDAFDVTREVSTAAGARAPTIAAEIGDRVQIVVEGAQPDTVLLGELETRTVEAGIPARFELLAETPGSYPLVLFNEERRIGTLEIR